MAGDVAAPKRTQDNYTWQEQADPIENHAVSAKFRTTNDTGHVTVKQLSGISPDLPLT